MSCSTCDGWGIVDGPGRTSIGGLSVPIHDCPACGPRHLEDVRPRTCPACSAPMRPNYLIDKLVGFECTDCGWLARAHLR